MKNLKNVGMFIIVALFSAVFLGTPATAANDLGVGLRVVPKSDAQSQISGNTKLWFVVKQGNNASRELVLTGSANLDQLVVLNLVQLERIDGEPSISEKKSEMTPWVKFSENNFTLKKNQTKSILMTIAPPESVNSGSYEAYITVTAASADALQPGKAVTQAIIKNSARVAQPVFVGIGNYEDFKIDFELKDIDGIKNSDGKFLRVIIDNHGKSPISPSGQVQLKNLDFEQGTVGPFVFYASTIEPRSKAFVDVAIPDSVMPGNWKIFVSASQGNVTVTKEFSKNLTFNQSFDLVGLWIKLLIILLGLVLGLWAYRVLRASYSGDVVKSKKFTRRKSVEISDETKALIAELEAKTVALEAAVAKKTVRKKSVKKAAPKKTAQKAVKKVAKKAGPKMTSAPKKTITKKVAAKKPKRT